MAHLKIACPPDSLPVHPQFSTEARGCVHFFARCAVSIRGARLTPPTAAAQVPGLITEWADWIAGEGEQYEPIVRPAIAHHGFEAVHPFEDGNGRTERLLLNVMLLRAHYPSALLLRD